MPYKHLVLTSHALRRMIERNISLADVHQALERGEVIADYPDDLPFPSSVVSGTASGRGLHVVFADDAERQTTVIITTYIPDTEIWDNDFRSRQRP